MPVDRQQPAATARPTTTGGPTAPGEHLRQLRGGPRLTTFLFVLAFVWFGQVAARGARVLFAVHTERAWVGLTVNLLIGAGLLAWALLRVHAHWGPDSVVAPGPRDAAPERAAAPRTRRHPRISSWLSWLRWVIAAAALVLAGAAVAAQWGTLREALEELTHLDWRWLRWAIYAEGLSLVAFATLQRLLLRAGGVRLGLGSLLELTLAGNALAVSLPGGAAWSASFSFDQLRRWGVSRTMAGAMLAARIAVTTLALVTLLVVGVNLAGGKGPLASARLAVTAVGIALGLAGIGIELVLRWPLAREIAGRRLAALPRGPRWRRWVAPQLQQAAERLAGVRVGPRLSAAIFGAGLGYWVADAACLAMAILCVFGRVPWQGLVTAYVLAQLAADLPLTPGGLGVVEGALTVTLVAFGMPRSTAIAAVLLYRLISFWALLPIGWSMLGSLVLLRRRGRVAAEAGG